MRRSVAAVGGAIRLSTVTRLAGKKALLTTSFDVLGLARHLHLPRAQ